MALAQLCCMLQEYPFARRTYGFQFKAFIVDHMAREGSTEEANVVKDNLSRMGTNLCRRRCPTADFEEDWLQRYWT